MRSTKRSPKTIDEYLASLNANHRDALQEIREAIHAVAPNAEECISYGIPAFRLNDARWFSLARGRIIARCIRGVLPR